MEFQFSNPEYRDGSGTGLQGLLPLFLRNGTFDPPAIMKNPEALKGAVRDNVVKARALWEEMDDAGIEVIMRDNVIMASHISPRMEIGDPRMVLFLDVYSGQSRDLNDDMLAMVEDYPDFQPGYKNIAKRYGMYQEIVNGDFEVLDTFAMLCPVGESELLYFMNSLKTAEKFIPDLRPKLRPTFKEMFQRMTALTLLMENEPKDGFSEERLRALRGRVTGLLYFVELLAGIRNVKVAKEIRSSHLFKIVKEAFVTGSALLFDLTKLHLASDNGNGIRRQQEKGGGSIKSIFSETLAQLYSQHADIRAGIKKLQKYYPADENVLEYLDILQDAWDGHILALKHHTAYQNIKWKLRYHKSD